MTTLKVVSDSTPLIVLARINRFGLLQELFGELRYYQKHSNDAETALNELLAQSFRLSKTVYAKILEQIRQKNTL
jgi:predicted nucleic acid-binding protein